MFKIRNKDMYPSSTYSTHTRAKARLAWALVVVVHALIWREIIHLFKTCYLFSTSVLYLMTF